MHCDRCKRRISPKKIEAKQYVYSKFTGKHYCGPRDERRCDELHRQRSRQLEITEVQ